MSTSHPISTMFRPVPGERVPGVTLRYFNARHRRRKFDLLMREFKRSGITRAELAKRTGKSRALISRLLGQPSNMTSDTMSELMFAISGREVGYIILDGPFSKQTHPDGIAKGNGQEDIQGRSN